MIAGEKASVDSKQKIRNRYRGVDPSELEVIPAIATDEIALEERKLKVAAYVRVSSKQIQIGNLPASTAMRVSLAPSYLTARVCSS